MRFWFRFVAPAFVAVFALLTAPAMAAGPKLVLVTFDGVRWQDVFRGADPRLVDDKAYVNPDLKSDVLDPAYVQVKDRAAALMPFLHGVVAKQGVLIGNRDQGQCASVANDMWFSYPGYSEIVTGKPDPTILENDKIWNPRPSFLEYANQRPGFRGKVAMVGTWTLFPYILNTQRSKLPVNHGFGDAYPTDTRTGREGLALLKAHNRVTYIAFGDTDELAHAGDYAGYLAAMERADEYLRQVWDLIQSDPYYRDQTTMIVSTDHGRGKEPLSAWRDHAGKRYFDLNPTYQPEFNATGVIGSDEVWIAALGPTIDRAKAPAYTLQNCAYSAQIASSALSAVGLDWRAFDPTIAKPLSFVKKP